MGSPGPCLTRGKKRQGDPGRQKSIKLRHDEFVQGGFARRSAGMKPAERLVYGVEPIPRGTDENRVGFSPGALLLGGHAFAAEPKKFDISMFPAAEVNQERVVIRLPEVENEADMMVELQVGKKMLVDCNLPASRAIWNSTASRAGVTTT